MNLTGSNIRSLQRELAAEGWGDDVRWSEACAEPETAEEFALEAAFVICNSGMKFEVAGRIFEKVRAQLRAGESASTVFGHAGKAGAIDSIWRDRDDLFRQFLDAEDKVEFCGRLPWIGPTTKFHLAKNFGVQVAKPDVHLERLAKAHNCSAQALCERLAEETGLKVATVDVILWRACATGILRP